MCNKAQFEGGKIRSYWLGAQHVAALESFQKRKHIRTKSEAVRKILDVIAQIENEYAENEAAQVKKVCGTR